MIKFTTKEQIEQKFFHLLKVIEFVVLGSRNGHAQSVPSSTPVISSTSSGSLVRYLKLIFDLSLKCLNQSALFKTVLKFCTLIRLFTYQMILIMNILMDNSF